MNRNKAIILVLLTGVIWSTGGFMVKLISWPPLVISGLRSGIAMLVILLFNRPKNIKFSKNTILGAFFYAVMVIFFVIANKLTSAGNVILIQYAAPFYVAVSSFVFLKERPTNLDWITIIILLVGLSLFFFEDLLFDQLLGNIFGIISGFGFAGTILFMRKQKDGRPIDSILLGNLITFIICSPFYAAGITNEPIAWVGILYLGIFQLGLSYCLYSIAIKYISALDASIYPVIEPLSSPLFAFFILGETMTNNAIIGGVIILLIVTLRGLIQNKNLKDQILDA
ncbi:MAG: DMT family transporter [Candidatus Neomarinimicrobiota bacterium]